MKVDLVLSAIGPPEPLQVDPKNLNKKRGGDDRSGAQKEEVIGTNFRGFRYHYLFSGTLQTVLTSGTAIVFSF